MPQQLEAVKAFQALPEAESLAAANKRVANILKQAEAKGESFANAERKSSRSPPSGRCTSSSGHRENANALFDEGDYTGYLKTFSVLKAPVDSFFDSVMVMVEDEKLRRRSPRPAARPARRHEPRRRHFQAGAMKLVILDRDGTINHDSDQYIKSPEEFRPIKGSLEAIARLTQADYRIVVATNQSGIARGLFDTRTLFAIHDALLRALAQVGGRIDAFFFCPHEAEDRCACRKPQPGMLLEVARRFNVALDDVSMVGDAQRDLRGRGRRGRKAGAGAHGQGAADPRRRQAPAWHTQLSPTSRRSPSIWHRDGTALGAVRARAWGSSRRPTRCSRCSPSRCRAWRATASFRAGLVWWCCWHRRFSGSTGESKAAKTCHRVPRSSSPSTSRPGKRWPSSSSFRRRCWCSSASCCGSRSSAGASR